MFIFECFKNDWTQPSWSHTIIMIDMVKFFTETDDKAYIIVLLFW
jgi:hypothetical protein